MTNMQIGDKIYFAKDDSAKYGYWTSGYITGENNRSWLLASSPASAIVSYKLPKNLRGYQVATHEQADRDKWMHNNKHRISEMVGRLFDSEKLKQVAEIINYQYMRCTCGVGDAALRSTHAMLCPLRPSD